MIILQQNDNKLTLFNERTREFAKKNPEFADYCKPLDSIDDMFTPYNSWMDSFTEEDKVKYKIVPDGEHDFSGVYVCADFNDHYNIERLTDYKEHGELHNSYSYVFPTYLQRWCKHQSGQKQINNSLYMLKL